MPSHDALPVQPPTPEVKHFGNNAKRQQLLGMRSWLKVDSSGEIQFVLLDKYKVVHEYGVQLRDLRILDPNLATTYPSAILCREKALIINIEHIRLIITPELVMVRNAEDSPVTQFMELLKRRLAQQPAAGHAHHQAASLRSSCRRLGSRRGSQSRSFTQQLPFELQALEVCLEQVGAGLHCRPPPCTWLQRSNARLAAASCSPLFAAVGTNHARFSAVIECQDST
jgi:hypothetical protein